MFFLKVDISFTLQLNYTSEVLTSIKVTLRITGKKWT